MTAKVGLMQLGVELKLIFGRLESFSQQLLYIFQKHLQDSGQSTVSRAVHNGKKISDVSNGLVYSNKDKGARI